MERVEIVENIRNEIKLLAGKEVQNNDFEIFGKLGILDSLNIMHIILHIESHYNIKINAFELTLDTLGSVNKIVDYIESKKND